MKRHVDEAVEEDEDDFVGKLYSEDEPDVSRVTELLFAVELAEETNFVDFVHVFILLYGIELVLNGILLWELDLWRLLAKGNWMLIGLLFAGKREILYGYQLFYISLFL
jgi:hypothetical protein